MDRPVGWEVDPDEYLGADGVMQYYRVGEDVYRNANGYTSWVCTYIAWQNTKIKQFYQVA